MDNNTYNTMVNTITHININLDDMKNTFKYIDTLIAVTEQNAKDLNINLDDNADYIDLCGLMAECELGMKPYGDLIGKQLLAKALLLNALY
jgi:hypothetical protein